MRVGYVRGHFRHEEGVALVALVDTDATLAAGEQGEDAREEEALYVEDCIKGAVLFEESAGCSEGFESPAKLAPCDSFVKFPPVPAEDFVHIGIAPQEVIGGRAAEPGKMRIRQEEFQIVRHGGGMEHIPDGGEAYQEDAGAGR